MHKDAVENYAANTLEPLNLQEWDDKTIVLTLWGNTRYQRMTGDTRLESISANLRARWYGDAGSVAEAKSDSNWKKLRAEFEEHGWQ